MMVLVKKYCDMLPGLSPENKHEMEAICTPGCVSSYPDGVTEADFVSSRWRDECRYRLCYEPHPMYIHVDERKHTADCVLREEVFHPKTGELINDYWDKWKPGLGGVVYLRESFGFQTYDGKVKINNVFMGPRIDTDSTNWQRWRDLCKP
jgi:hypothetical protein